ncbi:hypothetical protein SAMN05442782_10159 [Streptomyces sp. OK228]|nr:hypothetical protein SAMN05442782_10159 [Streptomyces sp. OK228]
MNTPQIEVGSSDAYWQAAAVLEQIVPLRAPAGPQRVVVTAPGRGSARPRPHPEGRIGQTPVVRVRGRGSGRVRPVRDPRRRHAIIEPVRQAGVPQVVHPFAERWSKVLGAKNLLPSGPPGPPGDGATDPAARCAGGAEPLGVHGGLTVAEVLGGGEQGDLVVGGEITQVPHGRPVIGVRQFADVAIPELRKALLSWWGQWRRSADGATSRSHSSRWARRLLIARSHTRSTSTRLPFRDEVSS